MMSENPRTPVISKRKVKEFEVLVKNNMNRAYFSALGLLGSHDAAMDVSQEAFIRAYRNFDKYDSSRNFFTWYYKIMKNLCLNFIRDNKKRKNEYFLEYKVTGKGSQDPEQQFEAAELSELLHDAINQLDLNDREVIILREFEGYNYAEISEMLNVPVGTVMSRLFYARKKLAEKMKRVMK